MQEVGKLFANSGAAIVRALGHNETIAIEPTPIGKLCDELHLTFKLNDARLALRKKRSTSKLSLLPKRERIEEMNENYFVKLDAMPYKRILVIDDILTTGATMQAIVNAIQLSMPMASIKLFTFAFCEYFSDLNTSINLSGYNYNWQSEGGWLTSDMDNFYAERLDDLRKRILLDDFN
jgi:hypothetical protein